MVQGVKSGEDMDGDITLVRVGGTLGAQPHDPTSQYTRNALVRL